LNDTQVFNLSSLAGMPLDTLEFDRTGVFDLSPLLGMKLLSLSCVGTKVTDLSLLAKMPLQVLHLDPLLAAHHARMLRAIATLETINDKPATKFWEAVGAPTGEP
jgi:hypothetical protein